MPLGKKRTGETVSSRKDAIRHFFRSRLKFFMGLAIAALAAALVAGAVAAHRYRGSPEYAFKRLRDALNEDDKAKLAALIDFRSLSADIVQGVLSVHPQAAANGTQKMEMQDEAQRLVFKALAAVKESKAESAAPRKLFEAVPFVPDNVIAQFTAGMKLEKASGAVQIHSQFTHDGLQADFPIRLLMELRQNGWLATRLLNARELADIYKTAREALQAQDESKLAEKNEKIMSRMQAHFTSPRCLVSVNLTSGRQEAMLVVKVTAKNAETTTLHNVNLLCDIRAGDRGLVYSRQLNAVQRVYGGGDFSNIWTVLLDADSGEAASLLQSGPLSCTVEPKVMSVGAGEVLYLRKD